MSVVGVPFEPTPGQSGVNVPANPGDLVIDMPPVTMLPPDPPAGVRDVPLKRRRVYIKSSCLLYTSDAADDM
eukprot:10514231-Prorocentrum_lima.AAC.1